MESEHTETNGSALVPVVEKPTPLPAFSGPQMAVALTAYRELQNALDRAMPDQIMQIQGKPFRRKGYWRAVATAFNLAVECSEERRETAGEDWGWLVTYKATAPSGRAASGDGACFASEKSRGSMKATEHNVRSHAHTRAYNRAVSNLVAFGEVSAEEMPHDGPPPAQRQQARGKAKAAPAAGVIGKAERDELWRLALEAWPGEANALHYLKELIAKHGYAKGDDIKAKDFHAICDEIKAAAFPDESPGGENPDPDGDELPL